jgi:hypothetical protein
MWNTVSRKFVLIDARLSVAQVTIWWDFERGTGE